MSSCRLTAPLSSFVESATAPPASPRCPEPGCTAPVISHTRTFTPNGPAFSLTRVGSDLRRWPAATSPFRGTRLPLRSRGGVAAHRYAHHKRRDAIAGHLHKALQVDTAEALKRWVESDNDVRELFVSCVKNSRNSWSTSVTTPPTASSHTVVHG
eukprot:PhM_4_TR18601/c0_g2_i1/m.30914